MTDRGEPMSRRQRRAMEQGAGGQEASTETGSIPTLGPDGKPLSRRDRRRLERSERPMETWTAEEERIATGQIPAMTPEVIAEQERLAREKAEAAAAEARAVSAELRRVTSASQVSASTPVTPVEGNAAPPIMPVAPEPEAPSTPAAGRPAWMDDIAQAVGGEQDSRPSALSDPDAFSQPAPRESAYPEPVSGGEPGPWPESGSEAETVSPFETATPESNGPQGPSAESERPQEPVSRAPELEDSAPEWPVADVAEPRELQSPAVTPPQGDAPAPTEDPLDDIPEAFRHLFPPGSLQARRMREQAQAAREDDQAQESEASQAEAPASSPSDAAEATDVGEAADAREDAAEEIRRLTASAMAGIDQYRQDEPVEEQVSDAAASNPYATGEQPQVASEVSGEQPQWNQQPDSGERPWAAASDQGQFDTEPSAPQTPSPFAGFVPREEPQEAERGSQFDAAAWPAQPPDSMQEEVPSFDALVGGEGVSPEHGTPAIPELDDRTAHEAPGQTEQWNQQPAPGEQSQGAPQYGAPVSPHPLAGTQSPSQETPRFEPDQGAHQPDLSQLSAQTPGGGQPVSGQPPTNGQPGSFEAPPTTGSIEVPRREVPDLQPAGGANHFRWAHLAVIGAIAFVLGVVVWNLAGPGL